MSYIQFKSIGEKNGGGGNIFTYGSDPKPIIRMRMFLFT